MKKILLLYVPVLHAGYLNIFKKYAKEIDCLYILGQEFTVEFAYLEKEIRAIDPETMRRVVESLGLIKSVYILDHDSIKKLAGVNIITAREGVMERLIAKYLSAENITYDTVFLRWDEKHVTSQKPVGYDRVSHDSFDKKMITQASQEGSRTSCWWREVGAVVVRNGEIIMATHNTHVPSEHSPYALGDIRDFIPAGKHNEISSSLHAEKSIIAEAARSVLEGASIYLSVFPCPDCAKLIAHSGIKKVYFSGGHASFDGEVNLRAEKVEIIFVEN